MDPKADKNRSNRYILFCRIIFQKMKSIEKMAHRTQKNLFQNKLLYTV